MMVINDMIVTVSSKSWVNSQSNKTTTHTYELKMALNAVG